MSSTRRRGFSELIGSWNTGWISRARSRRSIAASERPSIRTVPDDGGSRPSMMRASVDLPQPDSPTIASARPPSSDSDMSSTATTRLGAAIVPPVCSKIRDSPVVSIATVMRRNRHTASCRHSVSSRQR